MARKIGIGLKTIGVWLILATFGACAAHSFNLETLKSKQRHELYKGCIDTQMKQAAHGHGMAVHRACLAWAGRQR
jgi:hypothetical protein